MSKIREIAILCTVALIILFGTEKISAQQDPMYVQYIDNLLMVNPGYAGSKTDGRVLLVSRDQWVSVPGAPVTRSLSYNTPLKNNKIGLGFSVMNDKIGPQQQTGVYFDYAYFLKVAENYRLGMGLKGGVSFYRAALTELDPINPDPVFSKDIYKNFLPNLGVGLYLYSDNTYFGVSIPKLIENTITNEDYETEYVEKERIHFYYVMGGQFKLAEDFDLKASSMIKLVKNAPVSADISAMAGFKQRFWVGGMYRFDSAFGIIAQFQVTQKMVIGYSYELPVQRISNFSNGTHEIMFGYNLNIFR
jgi:type IX secretion system PorP/SprF family membrane protein